MYRLGLNMKLYYKVNGVEDPGTFLELTNVRDLTLSLESDRADLTVRGSGGWRQEVPTLSTATIEFGMVWDTADAGFVAFKDAFLSKGIIGIQCLDGPEVAVPPETEGGQGLQSDMGVFSFTRNEELAEGVTVDVTLAIAYGAVPVWLPDAVLLSESAQRSAGGGTQRRAGGTREDAQERERRELERREREQPAR